MRPLKTSVVLIIVGCLLTGCAATSTSTSSMATTSTTGSSTTTSPSITTPATVPGVPATSASAITSPPPSMVGSNTHTEVFGTGADPNMITLGPKLGSLLQLESQVLWNDYQRSKTAKSLGRREPPAQADSGGTGPG